MNTLLRWTSETDANIPKEKKKPEGNKNSKYLGIEIKEIKEEKEETKKNMNWREDNKMEETTINIGIVAAEFNYDVTYAMLELAKEHANFLEANVKVVMKVPGVFDIPLGVKKLMQNQEIHAVVALGAVVEGQTEHDEIIAQHATRKMVDLSLEYDKPIGLGISGPGMSRLEAHERVEYAKRAVEAAVKMVKKLRAGGEGIGGRFSGFTGGSSTGRSSEAEEKAFAGLREMG